MSDYMFENADAFGVGISMGFLITPIIIQLFSTIMFISGTNLLRISKNKAKKPKLCLFEEKMAEKKCSGSIKRFGVRYGLTVKNKFAKVEAGHLKRNKCPYCKFTAVKRLSAGIWQCSKCKAKFAGKAYTFSVKKPAQAAFVEEYKEPVVEEEEEVEA